MNSVPNIPDGIQTALQVWMLKEIFSLKAHVRQLNHEQREMKKNISKPMVALLIGLPILAALTGCTGLADTVKAASGDPATLKIHVTTPWGSADMERIGFPTNSVSK